MTFYLKFNEEETTIPVTNFTETGSSHTGDVGVINKMRYGLDIDVAKQDNYEDFMLYLQDFFEEDSISSIKIIKGVDDIIYQTSKYNKIDSEYLRLDELGEQLFTLHFIKDIE